MTIDLRDLYHGTILDHSRHPRNYQAIEPADRSAEGHNPLCGDRVTLYLSLEGEVIRAAGFQGAGCAISQASASLMTEKLKGCTLDEARAISRVFREMVGGSSVNEASPLGELTVFRAVAEYPTRAQCARLAWDTLDAVLGPSGQEP